MTTAPISEALTVPEVMTVLRLSRAKVYDLLRSRQLPSFTVGRSRRVRAEDVAAYMRNRLEESY
ncbi:helix-turn-helix domain-containing protein [Streptomyces humicola]|nr:helix-turn-helix domain-containing protein [Streptomyces humicola]